MILPATQPDTLDIKGRGFRVHIREGYCCIEFQGQPRHDVERRIASYKFRWRRGQGAFVRKDSPRVRSQARQVARILETMGDLIAAPAGG